MEKENPGVFNQDDVLALFVELAKGPQGEIPKYMKKAAEKQAKEAAQTRAAKYSPGIYFPEDKTPLEPIEGIEEVDHENSLDTVSEQIAPDAIVAGIDRFAGMFDLTYETPVDNLAKEIESTPDETAEVFEPVEELEIIAGPTEPVEVLSGLEETTVDLDMAAIDAQVNSPAVDNLENEKTKIAELLINECLPKNNIPEDLRAKGIKEYEWVAAIIVEQNLCTLETLEMKVNELKTNKIVMEDLSPLLFIDGLDNFLVNMEAIKATGQELDSKTIRNFGFVIATLTLVQARLNSETLRINSISTENKNGKPNILILSVEPEELNKKVAEYLELLQSHPEYATYPNDMLATYDMIERSMAPSAGMGRAA